MACNSIQINSYFSKGSIFNVPIFQIEICDMVDEHSIMMGKSCGRLIQICISKITISINIIYTQPKEFKIARSWPK